MTDGVIVCAATAAANGGVLLQLMVGDRELVSSQVQWTSDKLKERCDTAVSQINQAVMAQFPQSLSEGSAEWALAERELDSTIREVGVALFNELLGQVALETIGEVLDGNAAGVTVFLIGPNTLASLVPWEILWVPKRGNRGGWFLGQRCVVVRACSSRAGYQVRFQHTIVNATSASVCVASNVIHSPRLRHHSRVLLATTPNTKDELFSWLSRVSFGIIICHGRDGGSVLEIVPAQNGKGQIHVTKQTVTAHMQLGNQILFQLSCSVAASDIASEMATCSGGAVIAPIAQIPVAVAERLGLAAVDALPALSESKPFADLARHWSSSSGVWANVCRIYGRWTLNLAAGVSP